MITMSSPRGNWRDKSSSHSHHSSENERLYDYGVSTDRPMTAPPAAEMGFNMLEKLGEISSQTWGDEANRYNHNNLKELQFNAPNTSEDILSDVSRRNSSNRNQFRFNGSPTGNPSLGESITRPKSAAPQLVGGDHSHGLGIFHSETDPSTSSLFKDFDIMKVGTRRSASTGVIGHGPTSTSVMDSLGLIPAHGTSTKKHTSFMDLIQEDFPKSPSPSPEIQQKSVQSSDNFTKILDPASSSSHQAQPSGGYSHQPTEHHVLMHDIPHANGEHIERQPIASYQNMERHHLVPNQNNNAHYPVPNNNVHSNVPYSRDQPRSQVPLHGHGLHPSLAQGYQNNFEQTPNGFYSTPQRNGVATHPPPPPQMHPQIIHTNTNAPPPPAMYVNPPYGGGYTTVQYHQGHFPHGVSPVIHAAHDPNMSGRISHHQQYVTTLPMQGGLPGQMNTVPPPGTYIYFHPQAAPAPNSAHHQTVTVVDASGRSTIAIPAPSMPNVNRKQTKVVTMMGNKGVERGNRKSSRGSSGKKGSGSSSLDLSRHSISSGTLSLLEDYRSSKDRSWTASDVKGHIVEFCQDQNGSRFIQQRLELAKEAEKALIVSEVLPSVHLLRNDVFGNYVVQKLFDHSTIEMKSKLKRSLEGEMLNLSTQIYGCRVVQKALERVSDVDLIDLLAEFHNDVLSYIHDQNGNHVIQKVIEVVSNRSKTYQAEDKEKAIQFSKQLDFILDCIMKNIVPLSCHPFGCRVLQRILEHCIESQKSFTLDGIQQCLRVLLDDQYGNYVIQHVLQFGRKSDRDIILEIILENGMLELSRQKFASNVIEKLLKYGNFEHRNSVVREMLKIVEDKAAENGSCSVALLMVRDAYANYVVQTTLDVVPDGEEKRLLLEELKSNSAQLRNYTFAKHIITKLEETDGGARH